MGNPFNIATRGFFACIDCRAMGSRTLMLRLSPVALFILFAVSGQEEMEAQESIRPSLASSQSAEANKPAISSGQYNLQLGPALVGFSSNVDVIYNDNIDLSETDRKSDLIIEPSVAANLLWQVSEDNALRLNIGAGYVKYLNNPQFDSSTVAISPDSQIAFDIYAGDFKFTIFDQFSIQQNPLDEIDLSRVAQFERLQNSAGVNVTWDLNKLILFGGYAHYNFYSLDSDFDFLNENEDQLYCSATLLLSDALSVGLRGTFGDVRYDQDFQNDSIDYSAGVFATAQLTRYMKANAEVGYQGAHFNGGGGNGDSSQLNSPYFHVQLDHRQSRYWTNHFSFGYEAQLGLTTNYTSVFYVRYQGDWRVNSRTNAGITAYYEHSADSSGTFEVEHIDRFGAGIQWTYALGRKVNLHGSYQIIDNNSDLIGHSFYDNQVLIGVGYVF
jgi:hypothetical protein